MHQSYWWNRQSLAERFCASNPFAFFLLEGLFGIVVITYSSWKEYENGKTKRASFEHDKTNVYVQQSKEG